MEKKNPPPVAIIKRRKPIAIIHLSEENYKLMGDIVKDRITYRELKWEHVEFNKEGDAHSVTFYEGASVNKIFNMGYSLGLRAYKQ